MRTVPDVGKVTAAQKPSSVLLPAPLGLGRAQCSPSCTVSEMPSMICSPSRRNVTSASSRTGVTRLPLPQRLQRLVGVGVHAELAGDHVEHGAVGVDHERRALDRHELAEQPALDAELRGDGALGVGQQRVVEALLVGELGLLLNGIGADADAAGADGGELRSQVAEVAGLLGTARRHRRGIEEQHDRAVGEKLCEASHSARLVR